MSNTVNNNLNINTFIKNIKLNKNFITHLQNRIIGLNLDFDLTKLNLFIPNLTYIVYIIQNKTNLVMHIANSNGDLIYSVSANSIGFSGKAKQKARALIVKKFLYFLISSNQLAFLKNKPVALHLTNIGFIKQWVVKKFKNFFF